MRYCITLLLFGLAILGRAQSMTQSTIQWNSERVFDSSNGDIIDKATTLISHGADRLEWRNADGSLRKTYQIEAVLQDWTDVRIEGRARYKMTDGEFGGIAIFERTATEIRIILVLAKDVPESYEIIVKDYQVIQ